MVHGIWWESMRWGVKRCDEMKWGEMRCVGMECVWWDAQKHKRITVTLDHKTDTQVDVTCFLSCYTGAPHHCFVPNPQNIPKCSLMMKNCAKEYWIVGGSQTKSQNHKNTDTGNEAWVIDQCVLWWYVHLSLVSFIMIN